jgi:hypothetical protein
LRKIPVRECRSTRKSVIDITIWHFKEGINKKDTND